MINKIVFSLSIIFSGILLGYLLQSLYKKKRIPLPVSREKLRKDLQKITFLFLAPVSFVGAIWIANINTFKAVSMPLMGMTAFLAGALFAYLAAVLMKLSKPKTGIYIISGSFSNIGSIGGLVCYAFFGETGYALTPIYNFVLPAVYFAIGFPVVRYFSNHFTEKERLINRFTSALLDPFVLVSLGSIGLGFILNFSGINRPRIYADIIAVFVPLGNFLMLISVGLELKLSKMKKYLKECMVLSLIKFIFVPLITGIIAWKIGLGQLDGGLPLKVVIILSSMPVALIALVPSSIYDLGLNMVNSCWLFTTIAMVVIIPALYFLLNLI
ncbi:MAG TPA: hypothetical protein VJ958_03875 [Atribacterota bacterium]|nr:hypothetical protein [Atribacterota bacterium]